MSNLYSLNCDKRSLFDTAKIWRDRSAVGTLLPAISRNRTAPVIREGISGEREMLDMQWGLPPPPDCGTNPVTNIRNARAGWWRRWLGEPASRCLVPATSFCLHQHGVVPHLPVWFALDESRPPFFFAGIWRSWVGTPERAVAREALLFAILITEANASVAPVHPLSMPVLLLSEEEREIWLHAPLREALALQKPAAAFLPIVAQGEKSDPGPVPLVRRAQGRY
jgi:putative SOS response-associated peptidase YedK